MNNTLKKSGNFNKHRIPGILCLSFIIAVLLTGCGMSGDERLEKAAECFNIGDYTGAETQFLALLRENPADPVALTGYGFTLMKSEDYNAAEAVFRRTLELESFVTDFYGSEKDAAEAVRKGLYTIYMTKGDYAGAVEMLGKLSEVTPDKNRAAEYKAEAATLAWKNYVNGSGEEKTEPAEVLPLINESIEAGNNSIKAYRMRANLYYLLEDWDNWERDERAVMALKDYAADEYFAIFDVRLKHGGAQKAMELIDEMTGYMKAHASYIDSYDRLIAIALKGAELAEYNEGGVSPEHYFELAEMYIKNAEDKNLSTGQVLKYGVIVAERRGKLDVAYKLLGVYLEHCPDDRMAVKERNYLKNRVGIKE